VTSTLSLLCDALLRAVPSSGAHVRGQAVVGRLVLDSRHVAPGDLFAAVPGAAADGHEHAAAAVEAGASALLVQRWLDLPVPQLRVARVRATLGSLSAELQAHPAGALTLVGVTGTNGKTTVSLLLHGALLAAGRAAGVVGTLGTWRGHEHRPSPLTTPEAPDLHALLTWLRDGGTREVVLLEASSMALDQGRLDGLRFALAVHTGLEEEHLDFHGTMEQYWASKAALFTPGRSDAAVVRVDDPWGRRLATQVALPLVTFGSHPDADVRLTEVRSGLTGTTVLLRGRDGPVALDVPLLGRVNAVNATAAYLAARHLGLSRAQAQEGIAAAVAPPGRHSVVVAEGSPLVVVDFAHTPAALAALLDTGRELAAPGGRVLLVFGGRGDRDRGKRPELARVAAGADLLVLTADTTERESLETVLAEYRLGLLGRHVHLVVEQDRRQALRCAIDAGRPGDVVLVAGRGAEPLLTVGGRTQRFLDQQVVQQLLGVDDLYPDLAGDRGPAARDVRGR